MNNTGQKYSTKKIHQSLTFGLAILLMISVGFVVIPKTLGAPDTCTWTGNGDGTSFVDNSNWTGCDAGGIPEQGDSIIVPPQPTQITIDNDTNYGANLLLDDVTLNGNVILDGKYWDMSGTVTINGVNNILRADNGFRTTTELTSSTGGEVEFEDSIFIATDLPISGELIVTISPDADIDATNGGAVTIGEDAIVVIESTSADYFNTTSWTVNGTLECARASCLQATDTVNIADGGLFAFSGAGASTQASVITNGNALLTGRRGTNLIHSGTIEIQSGTLTVRGNELVPVDYTATNSFNLDGDISGPGNISITDSVILNGSNTYTGQTEVDNGFVMVLNDSSLGGDGPGESTRINENGSVVFNSGVNQIFTEFFTVATSSQTPGKAAFINLNNLGVPEFKNVTTIEGSRLIGTGSGSLKFNDDVVINNGIVTMEVPANSSIQLDTDIAGAGVINKTGQGSLEVYGDLSNTGGLVVSQGVLKLYVDGPNKNFSNPITVANPGSIGVEQSNVFVFDSDAIHTIEDLTLSGLVEFDTDALLNTSIRSLSGAGTLQKTGTGLLTLNPDTNNQYSGEIIVADGDLYLSGTDDIMHITPTNITVNQNANVYSTRNNVIVDTVDITISNLGEFFFNLADSQTRIRETFDAINGLGGRFVVDNGEIVIGADNTNGSYSGTITLANDSRLIKIGTGSQILEQVVTIEPAAQLNPAVLSNEDFTNGVIEIRAGEMILIGDYSATGVELNGGVLKASGTVDALDTSSGGTVKPGQSPGVLNITEDTNFSSATTLEFELDGPMLGTQYDHISVTGNVVLDNPTLEIVPGYEPEFNEEFTIIQSTENLSGTFNQVPNGSTVLVPFNGVNHNYRVLYSSNSVVITYLGNSQFAQTGVQTQYAMVMIMTIIGIIGVGYTLLKKPTHE